MSSYKKILRAKLFILLCIVALSCNSRSNLEITVENFPIDANLKAEGKKISEKLLIPSDIFLFKNKLIIYDNGKKDLFKVFRLNDLKYLYSWGEIGRGPGEFRSVDGYSTEVTNYGLEVKDVFNIKCFELEDDTVKMKKEKILPLTGEPLNRLRKINDSIYFSDNYMGDSGHEHLVINVNKREVIDKFGEYSPDNLVYERNEDKFMIHGKSNVYNNAQGKFATFYYFFNRLKIYNTEKKLLKVVNLAPIDKNNKKLSVENKNENVFYNYQPYATDKFIYVLNVEQPKSYLKENMDKFKPSINVWDWDGNPIATYHLDKPLMDFVVDENGGKLYGTTAVHMDVIFTYNIPFLIE